MKPKYTNEQLKHAKSFDKLPLECYECNKDFFIAKTHIKDAKNPNCKRTGEFCSKQCLSLSKKTKAKYNCHNCGKECEKKISQIKLSKSGYNFCSRSCTSSYHMKNKKYGTNRSKLEQWIEIQLTKLYPNLKISYNDRQILNPLELDIFIPELSIAFELNGIFHYEPIFGPEKLNKTQTKDFNKHKLCFDKRVDLCVIDTSSQKYFKEQTSNKFLNIIIKIIQERF